MPREFGLPIAERIADLLADGRAATVPEIARELRLRDIDVRDTLRSDPRFERSPAAPGLSPQARAWAVAREVVPTRPDPLPPLASAQTGNEPEEASAAAQGFWRLVLADDAPHSVGEAVAAADDGEQLDGDGREVVDDA